MCIISNKVEKVAKTKILVGVNKLNPSIQLTVYCNSVSNNTDGNAMILPVPNPNTVKFHDLSNYKDFFSDCNKSFWKTGTFGKSSAKCSNSNINNTLEVYNVGSYKVSLAKSLEDLKNIDTSIFKLSSNCAKMLTKEYSNPIYGFIICKLAKGKEDYHPFGYSHKMVDNTVFIPTKHYHEHNIFSNFFNSFNFSIFSWQGNLVDDWEHEIFLYNVTGKNNKQLQNMNSNYDEDWIGVSHLKFFKLDFDLDKLYNFEKYKIFGSKPNIDLIGITCFDLYKNLSI